MFLRFTSKQTYRIFCSCIFVCHTPQFKLLVFAFRSEIWIVQNFNFTVFEDFCLSLSWKYRFLQNVNHAKVQSKNYKHRKFHVDLTRRRLSKSRFKKLGVIPKKLYRNTFISKKCIPVLNGLVSECLSSKFLKRNGKRYSLRDSVNKLVVSLPRTNTDSGTAYPVI